MFAKFSIDTVLEGYNDVVEIIAVFNDQEIFNQSMISFSDGLNKGLGANENHLLDSQFIEF